MERSPLDRRARSRRGRLCASSVATSLGPLGSSRRSSVSIRRRPAAAGLARPARPRARARTRPGRRRARAAPRRAPAGGRRSAAPARGPRAPAAGRSAGRSGSSAPGPAADCGRSSVRLVRPSPGETCRMPASLVTGTDTADAPRSARPGRRRCAGRRAARAAFSLTWPGSQLPDARLGGGQLDEPDAEAPGAAAGVGERLALPRRHRAGDRGGRALARQARVELEHAAVDRLALGIARRRRRGSRAERAQQRAAHSRATRIADVRRGGTEPDSDECRAPGPLALSWPAVRIGVLTGGGDCPGLNAVIRAIVRKGIDSLRARDRRLPRRLARAARERLRGADDRVDARHPAARRHDPALLADQPVRARRRARADRRRTCARSTSRG